MALTSPKIDGYIPDLKGRKEKVVLGLSGGLQSYVTAYLLKIQNYDLIGVTVINSWEDFSGEQDKVLSCHLDQTKLDEIKAFCSKLGIPFLTVKTSEFIEEVIGPWISSKLTGSYSNKCWNCHDLRMRALYRTMKESGANRIATGHFAKILLNEQTKEIIVNTSNDEVEDQSGLLSRLNHNILSKLILPLSDLTPKEVIKLAENFGLTEKTKMIKKHECLEWNTQLSDYFELKISPAFLKSGDVTSDVNLNHGQHLGIHHYNYGDKFEVPHQTSDEEKYIARFKFSDKSIQLKEESFFINNKLQLLNCNFSDGYNFKEPIKGFLNLKGDSFIECWIHPKSLDSVFLELSEDHKILHGEIVSVVKKKGKNSKVLLTGEVKLLPKDIDEGEALESKINCRIDF